MRRVLYRVATLFPVELARELHSHNLAVTDVGQLHVSGWGDDELDRVDHVIRDAADAAGIGNIDVVVWRGPGLAAAEMRRDRAERTERPFAGDHRLWRCS